MSEVPGTGFGSNEHPYREMPYAGYSTEVHWGGIFGVLTLTLSDLSSAVLNIGLITLGRYAVGAPIPRAEWQGRASAFIRFEDRSPIETIEETPDTPGPGPTTHQFVVIQIPGPLTRGSLPPPGEDEGADNYWGQINEVWSAAYSANAAAVAEQAGSGAPHHTTFGLSAEWGLSGGNITDATIHPAIGWPNASVGPVAIRYGWTTWPTAYPWSGTPMAGISATHLEAYSQINAFGDAVAGIWHVWDLVDDPGVIPGTTLESYREVFLIDFGQVQKDNGTTEVVIDQSWDEPFDGLTGAGYRNSYRLQLYRSANNFVAGPQQTVRLAADSAPSLEAYYDQTRTVAWNDGSQSFHPVLRFTAAGWPGAAPAGSPAALEAVG